MLPTNSALSSTIQDLIKNNHKSDSDQAIKEFADNLAKTLLDTLNAADVIMPIASISTTVAVTGATGTGSNLVECIGTLK